MGYRNPALIDGIGVADHGWVTFAAQAQGKAIVFPRGLGVFIKEISIPTITMTLNCWSIFTDIADKEERFNQDIPNRFTQSDLYTVVASGNTYNNCGLSAYKGPVEDNLRPTYSFQFALGDQGTATINANLKDGAGSVAIFSVPSTKILNRTVRRGGTFTFWSHNSSSVNTQWPSSVQTNSINTIKPLGGGLSNLNLNSWVIGPSEETRKNLELYFYSMGRDAVGRIGTLTVYGNTYEDCFFQSMSMSDDDKAQVTFNAQFISSTRVFT